MAVPIAITIIISMMLHLYYHHNDVIMSEMASQITSLTSVYSTVYSGTDQRKHQSSVSLAFVRGIYRGPANSPYKWPVTWKVFPFDDVIMQIVYWRNATIQFCHYIAAFSPLYLQTPLEDETKWLPFCRQHFQIHSHVWKSHFHSNFTAILPRGLIDVIPALVQIMAWRWSGIKLLSDPMMVWFNDAYMCH